jgi:hypothetical protein
VSIWKGFPFSVCSTYLIKKDYKAFDASILRMNRYLDYVDDHNIVVHYLIIKGLVFLLVCTDYKKLGGLVLNSMFDVVLCKFEFIFKAWNDFNKFLVYELVENPNGLVCVHIQYQSFENYALKQVDYRRWLHNLFSLSCKWNIWFPIVKEKM